MVRGRPGELAEGRFQQVAVGDDCIALQTQESESVTVVSKTSCAGHVAYESRAFLSGIATTGDQLYVVESGEAEEYHVQTGRPLICKGAGAAPALACGPGACYQKATVPMAVESAETAALGER